jgi:hypothetical protein
MALAYPTRPMRKVVDSNFLQSEELRVYLSKSPRNFAVLTDYASMEAYKGNTLVSICRSMQILANFPRQVIILKGTQTVCGLKGRSSGLQRRMIDETQTRGFGEWCRKLAAAERGDIRLQNQLLELGREATTQMDRILADARKFSPGLEEVSKTFTPVELKTLRTDAPYTEELFGKIIGNILIMAAFMFADHPRVAKLPPIAELPNTFIFRVALCAYLLALRWISVSGARNVNPERIRNDIVDLNFAAVATFFDGILTSDVKVRQIYHDAHFLLRKFFSRDRLHN